MAAAAAAGDALVEWLSDLGQEDANAKLQVYLITASRILPAAAELHNLRDLSQVSREQMANMVMNAVQQPLTSTGRPRNEERGLMNKLVVFRERHADGSVHFHIAIRLTRQMRFLPFKHTLRFRHHVCTHWSCSHRQWWSVVRYGTVPTPRKAEIDDAPYKWSADGVDFDLFEDSQQPFNAHAWRARREKQDCEASKKDKSGVFTKLDFTSLVLSKNLVSKKAVLAYAQERGTVAMQSFLCRNQRQLDKLIEDAMEWGRAREDAVREKETDWALICKVADAPCSFGDACEYAQAAQEIFEQNCDSFTQASLAAALRAVVICGPSKNTRVPFLVGPTNSGKSTLVYPFDDLFGFHAVFHKPALNDVNYPLRNWLKAKRFAMWGDFRPVEYAQAGVVPVATFLSAFNGDPFEVRVPQNLHDGNVDFAWKRGVVFTGKSSGLWDPSRQVSEEDVAHMQSRVMLFHVSQQLGRRRSISRCARCMCRWIVDGAATHDADAAVAAPAPVLPLAAGELGAPGQVEGLQHLMSAARLSGPVVAALMADVVAAGAVHVRELTSDDWLALPSWGSLRPLEKRRLTSAVQALAR